LSYQEGEGESRHLNAIGILAGSKNAVGRNFPHKVQARRGIANNNNLGFGEEEERPYCNVGGARERRHRVLVLPG